MGEVLQVTALPVYPDEIGRWLWAMQALRRRTLERARRFLGDGRLHQAQC